MSDKENSIEWKAMSSI